MVSDEEFRDTLEEYKRQTNMDSNAMKRFRKSSGWRKYAERKGGPPASEAYKSNLMLQRKIENGTISKSDYRELDKATDYLNRAKAEYFQEGAGDNKVPGTRTTFRVFALRNWAYDPYRKYS